MSKKVKKTSKKQKMYHPISNISKTQTLYGTFYLMTTVVNHTLIFSPVFFFPLLLLLLLLLLSCTLLLLLKCDFQTKLLKKINKDT